MSYEDFKARLDKVVEDRKFKENKTLTGDGFNNGLMTMYYAALSAFMNMETELIKEGMNK